MAIIGLRYSPCRRKEKEKMRERNKKERQKVYKINKKVQ